MQILGQELPDNLTWVSEFMAAWYPIVYIREFNEVFRVMLNRDGKYNKKLEHTLGMLQLPSFYNSIYSWSPVYSWSLDFYIQRKDVYK